MGGWLMDSFPRRTTSARASAATAGSASTGQTARSGTAHFKCVNSPPLSQNPHLEGLGGFLMADRLFPPRISSAKWPLTLTGATSTRAFTWPCTHAHAPHATGADVDRVIPPPSCASASLELIAIRRSRDAATVPSHCASSTSRSPLGRATRSARRASTTTLTGASPSLCSLSFSSPPSS